MAEEVSQGFLIDRALDVFRESGLAGVSFRTVAARANVPPTTLQYRFKTKDALLEHVLLAIIDYERERLGAIRDLIGSKRLTPEELADVFRAAANPVTLRSAGSRQNMAIDIVVASLRDPKPRRHARQWLELIHDFWSTVGTAGSRDDEQGWFLTELYVGILIPSVGIARPTEIAMLDNEIIDRAILGPSERAPIWYELCRSQALKTMDIPSSASGHRSKLIERLLIAGAEIIATEGPGKLTYRLLSTRAKTSLSAIVRHFPTQKDLLFGILQYMLRKVIANIPPDSPRYTESIEALADEITRHSLGGQSFDTPFAIIAAEIHELAIRNPELEGIAWFLRMIQGVGTPDRASQTHSVNNYSAFDMYSSSTWSMGCTLTCLVLEDRDKVRTAVATRIRYGLVAFKGLWPPPQVDTRPAAAKRLTTRR